MKTTIRLAIAASLALALSAHAGSLHDAAGTGNRHEINQLLANGLDPNQPDHKGHTPLHHAAVRFEMPELVRTLLDAGADPNARAKDGSTPLHYAAGATRHLAVGALLAGGADPNARNRDGDTPLHYLAADWKATDGTGLEGLAALSAVAGATATGGQTGGLIAGILALAGRGHMRRKIAWTVSALVEGGAELGARNDAGHTPRTIAIIHGHGHLAGELHPATIPSRALYYATKAGDVDAVNAALADGADVNLRLPETDGLRPLHEAVRRTDPRLARILLDAGADPDATTGGRFTPLHFAANLVVGDRDPGAMRRRAEIVRQLLDAGANRKRRSHEDRTAKDYATLARADTLVDLLNTYAVAVDTEANRELHEAVANADRDAIARLAQAGANLNHAGPDGRTALCRAVIEDREGTIIDALLAWGADVNARSRDRRTPLHCLAERKHRYPRDLAATLHGAGARLDLADENGRTPVHAAGAHNRYTLMDYLLVQRAKSDTPDHEGLTPWHVAAARDAVPTVAKLVKHRNAEVNIRGPVGETPLHSARGAGAEATARTLLVAGADPDALDHDGKTPADWAAAAGH